MRVITGLVVLTGITGLSHAFTVRLHQHQHKTSSLSAKSLQNNDCGMVGSSGEPHRSKNGRISFLGIRRDTGFMKRNSAEASQLGIAPLMPDGGLSPCVIKVLGVGGGGTNAVRFVSSFFCYYCFAEALSYYILEKTIIRSS
jgi:hypothetical protein